MNVIEADIKLMFVLLSYLPSPFRSNFLIDFSSSPRIHESILINFNEGLWNFGSAEKNGMLTLLLNCKNRVGLYWPENRGWIYVFKDDSSLDVI